MKVQLLAVSGGWQSQSLATELTVASAVVKSDNYSEAVDHNCHTSIKNASLVWSDSLADPSQVHRNILQYIVK